MRIFRQNCRENQTTYFKFNKCFFPKIVNFLDNMEKYGRNRQATEDNTVRRRKEVIYVQDNKENGIDTHTH